MRFSTIASAVLLALASTVLALPIMEDATTYKRDFHQMGWESNYQE